MARLIRTEKEVEGRYEEVWLVVEEDVLEQWPAGPRRIVGQPAARIDGLERARGEAVYTADLKLPGLLHTAVLRSPHAHARVTRIDLAPALAMPGVHAAVGPGRARRCWSRNAATRAPPSLPSAPTHYAQARAAVAKIDVDFEQLEVLLDPDEAVARGQLLGRAAGAHAWRPRARSRGGGRRRRGDLPHPDRVCTTRSRPTRRSCRGSATRSRSTSRRSTSGAFATRSRARSGCRPTRCGSSATTWAAASARRTAPTTTPSSRSSSRSGRTARCAARSRAARRTSPSGNRNATIQRLTIGARADGTLTALGGEYVNAIGWGGWSSPVEGPMQMLYACPNVKTTTWAAKLNQPPMKAFRAPGFVEGTFGLESPARRARREARSRPARAAPPQPRRHGRRRRPPLQRQEPARVLPPRRAALGAPPRGACALDRNGEARRGDGLPDLVRRRRPAELCVGAGRLRRPRHGRHRDAGRRHRHAHGAWRRSPPRSSGSRSSTSPSRSATPPAARSPRSRPARRRRRRWGRPSVPPPPTPGARSTRSRSSGGRPKRRWRRSWDCSKTRRSSVRAAAARTPRACRC